MRTLPRETRDQPSQLGGWRRWVEPGGGAEARRVALSLALATGWDCEALHALGEELRGPLVEHEAIDHSQLNAQQEDDQAGHEVLVAVEFHRLARRQKRTLPVACYRMPAWCDCTCGPTARAIADLQLLRDGGWKRRYGRRRINCC